MTTLEYVKRKLMDRGLTRQQCEAKLVPVVLDIIMECGDNVQEFQTKEKLERLKEDCVEAQKYLEKLRNLYREEIQKQQEWRDDIESYVNNLLSQIEKCETAEGRDRMKLAQMFVNSVNVDTKYDNTAFIIGLAGILSKGEVAPVDELRKINKKIPN